MFKTKLVETFFALSRNEQRNLCRWMASPFHNSRADLQTLCLYLYEKAYKNRDLLQKELVFKAVYGESTPFNEQEIRYASFFLLQQIESFLIYTTQKQQPDWQQLYLAKAYRRLRLGASFNKKINDLRLTQAKKTVQDAHYHTLQYQIELEDFVFLEQQERNAPRNLQPMVYALDVQYIAEKLKQNSFVDAHEAVYKTQYDRGLFSFVLEYLHRHPHLLQIPAIGLYYYYYNINIASNIAEKEAHFQQFKTMLLHSGHQFEQMESRDLYMLAINYTIRRFNTQGSKDELLIETLQLYQAALQGGFLLENKQLSPFTFKNIAGLAMRLQDLEWVQLFIQTYSPLLPAKDRDTYTHYALSKLAFTQRNYPEAMQRLQKVEYSDIFLNLDAKVMLLKIYYELGEYDALDIFLQTFNTFLRRKTQLGYHRDNYKNTLSFMQKLLHLHPITPKKAETLRLEIAQTAALGERDWLLKQLEGNR